MLNAPPCFWLFPASYMLTFLRSSVLLGPHYARREGKNPTRKGITLETIANFFRKKNSYCLYTNQRPKPVHLKSGPLPAQKSDKKLST